MVKQYEEHLGIVLVFCDGVNWVLLAVVLFVNAFEEKMPEFSTGRYMQLSNTVFVPLEWPVRGIEPFILKLANLVIDDLTSDRAIVLRVQDISTILVRHGVGEETKYFFQRITSPCRGRTEAYVIDVVIASMDNLSEQNSVISDDSSESSEIYISDEGISMDNYNIVTHQSENRTAYYFVLIQEKVQMLSINTEINYTQQEQRPSASWAKRQAMSYDSLLLLLAVLGIAALVYMATAKII